MESEPGAGETKKKTPRRETVTETEKKKTRGEREEWISRSDVASTESDNVAGETKKTETARP